MLLHMTGEWRITFRVARGEMVESSIADVRI